MTEVRGLIQRNTSDALPTRIDRHGLRLGEHAEHTRGKGRGLPRRYARRSKLAALVISASLVLSAVLVLSTSPSANAPRRTGLVNPLGTLGDVTWENKSPSVSPGARYNTAFVYDPPTDTFVLFGGENDQGDNFNDTWSYDLHTNSWQARSPSNHPDYVLGPASAYDPVDQVMLLFPCVDAGFTVLNQTWSYDASTNEWTNLAPTNSPPLKIYSCGAFDSESDRFVVYGGGDLFGDFLNETWSYDLTSNAWTMMPLVYSPTPAFLCSAVYDTESDRIVLFGGALQDPMGDFSLLNETWSYDLNTNNWSKMTSNAGPSQRYGISAVYDPASDLVITFGGVGFTFGGPEPVPIIYDDMWTYDLNTDTWTEVNQLAKPTERAMGAMAINPSDQILVLYGGAYQEQMTVLDDTWATQFGPPIPEFGTLQTLTAVVFVSLFVAIGARRRNAG